jgi:hypothetical protein
VLKRALMVEDHMQLCIQHLMTVLHLLLELGLFTFCQLLVSQEMQAGEKGHVQTGQAIQSGAQSGTHVILRGDYNTNNGRKARAA